MAYIIYCDVQVLNMVDSLKTFPRPFAIRSGLHA